MINIITMDRNFNNTNIYIKDIFNDYMNYLKELINNKNFILLNKIEILYNIYNYTFIRKKYCYYKLHEKYTLLYRLYNDNIWSEINYDILANIYSNSILTKNYTNNINTLIPINKLELLYNLEK